MSLLELMQCQIDVFVIAELDWKRIIGVCVCFLLKEECVSLCMCLFVCLCILKC